MKLRIADNLSLPLDAGSQKFAFLGRTGSGKSYAASKLAEDMIGAGIQTVALDPVGIWYGLRIAADGQGRGIQIPVFGGLHGDVPLESTGGALIADLIVDRGISAVIDVSQFESDAQKARFAADFAARLFWRKKAAPSVLMLVLEEAQEFAPQNPDKNETKMLHDFTRLGKIGRNFGIGLSILSQRPQEVNKKLLNMSECMFAFQMTGPHERKTIKEWVYEKGADVDIVELLPKLEVGQAHVWSPQWLKISETVKVGLKKTFDASSTPVLGATSHSEPTPLDGKDMEKLRIAMAETIERAKAADPSELRRQLAAASKKIAELASRDTGREAVSNDTGKAIENRRIAYQRGYDAGVGEAKKEFGRVIAPLRKELAGLAQKTKASSDQIQKEILLATEHLGLVAKAHHTMGDVGRRTAEIWAQISDLNTFEIPPSSKEPEVPKLNTRHDGSPEAAEFARLVPSATNVEYHPGEFKMDRLRRSILIALAQHEPEGLTKPQILLHSGYRASGKVSASFAELGRVGLVETAGQRLRITAQGGAALGKYEALPVGSELRKYLLASDKLGRVEKALLKAICDEYPAAVAKRDIIEQSGYQPSGKISAGFARLVRYGYAVPDSGGLKMAKELTDAYETA